MCSLRLFWCIGKVCSPFMDRNTKILSDKSGASDEKLVFVNTSAPDHLRAYEESAVRIYTLIPVPTGL